VTLGGGSHVTKENAEEDAFELEPAATKFVSASSAQASGNEQVDNEAPATYPEVKQQTRRPKDAAVGPPSKCSCGR
jgi:hypothetical protein